MIYKIRRIIEIALAVIVLIYAVLYMMKWNTYAFLLPYIFLAGGLLYFALEIVDKQPKKTFLKIILLFVPLILVAFSIKIITRGPVSSTFLTFCMLALLMSSLQKRLSPADQKS